MSADDHGSYSTYTNHGCRCVLCRSAWAVWNRRYRRRRRAALETDPSIVEHGKNSTYINYRCTCRECRAAHADYNMARKAARATRTP